MICTVFKDGRQALKPDSVYELSYDNELEVFSLSLIGESDVNWGNSYHQIETMQGKRIWLTKEEQKTLEIEHTI